MISARVAVWVAMSSLLVAGCGGGGGDGDGRPDQALAALGAQIFHDTSLSEVVEF